jgi:undecaprenyl-diphosphatase
MFNLSALGLAAILTFLLAQFIRFIYPHPRPFLILNITHLLTESTSSFPSGHTIFIFGMAAVSSLYSRRLSYFMFVSGLIVGIARIIAGVHYPLDIIGGIIFGILTGWCLDVRVQHHLEATLIQKGRLAGTNKSGKRK